MYIILCILYKFFNYFFFDSLINLIQFIWITLFDSLMNVYSWPAGHTSPRLKRSQARPAGRTYEFQPLGSGGLQQRGGWSRVLPGSWIFTAIDVETEIPDGGCLRGSSSSGGGFAFVFISGCLLTLKSAICYLLLRISMACLSWWWTLG